MADWWDGFSNERYWCEVTDRDDMGSDLKAPQKNEAGKDYWSYSLILDVIPGDIVFHYSIRQKVFAGASVAGGPMEERPIFWAPHGTTGRRAKDRERQERPGYWRPLYGYRRATPPLSLTTIEEPSEAAWLREWVDARRDKTLRLPFQMRKDGLRGGQGYLFKMPADFVERWTALRDLADALDERAEELLDRPSIDEPAPTQAFPAFRPKSEADYTAVISVTVQHRTRTHERLVRLAGEWLTARGVMIANQHPKDLEIISPVHVIIEAKVVHQRDPLFAAREAVGQLHEYRYFIGPRNAALAILLDVEPPAALIRYMEDHLQVAVLWVIGAVLSGGPLARRIVLDVVREMRD